MKDDVMASTGPIEPVPDRAYPRQTGWFYLELSAYWFALSFLWAGMITVVIQTMVEQMGGRNKDLYLGLVLGTGALVSTVVVIITGAMSDRSRWRMGKRRPYLIVGTLLSVPSLLLVARVHTILGLLGVFCLIQVWVNVATSPYQALIPDLVPKVKQGAASAYMGLGSLLGQLGGLVAATILMERPGGLWNIMVTYSVLLVLAMLYTVFRIPERAAVDNPAPRTSMLATIVDSFRVQPREHRDFFWLILSRFMVNMGFYTATEFLLWYLGDTLGSPHPKDTARMLFVIATLSGLLGNFPAGILSDRVSKKLVVYISGAITATAALVFVLTSSIPVALGAGFIFGAGFGAFSAVDWAFATNLLPQRDEAKYMGVWHVSFTVPQVVAPFIGGPIAWYVNNRVASVFGHAVGPGFGYRVVLFLVIIYFAIGMALIRPIRERGSDAVTPRRGDAGIR